MGSRMYEEGEMVRDIEWKAACDNCFCAMGAIRCVPLACAPPLQGCSPIVREGHCCPSTYNCSESQCLRIRVATISPFTRLGPPLDCVFSASSIIFEPWKLESKLLISCRWYLFVIDNDGYRRLYELSRIIFLSKLFFEI